MLVVLDSHSVCTRISERQCIVVFQHAVISVRSYLVLAEHLLVIPYKPVTAAHKRIENDIFRLLVDSIVTGADLAARRVEAEVPELRVAQ